ncbi:MAG TPA: hypothetical protein VEK84_15665 [Terriglobales bacterium]|nr:hypothetical protein [Terriglobales bacterium]
MLQAPQQLRLTRRRKLLELRIVFEFAALLLRWHIFVAAQPVSGVTGLVLGSMFRPTFRAQIVLLTWLFLLLARLLFRSLLRVSLPSQLMRSTPVRPLSWGERRREHQNCCDYAYEFPPAQHR